LEGSYPSGEGYTERMFIHFGAEISLKDETMGGRAATEKYLR
jgi:hypothetical protein